MNSFGWKQFNIALGFVASAVFLYLALREVEFSRLWQAVRDTDPWFLVGAVCLGVLANLVRALRWRFFYTSDNPPLKSLFSSMMIGYLANNILPARLGELVRILVLKRQAGVRNSTSAATIFLERVIDALMLLSLVGALSFLVPLPAAVAQGSRYAAAVFALLALALLVLAWQGEGLTRPLTGWLSRFSSRGAEALGGVFARFILGLGAFRSPRRILLVLLFTALVWSI